MYFLKGSVSNIEMETKPRALVVYYCHNLRLFKNGEQKGFARSLPGLKLVAIPCSGKVEAHHLLKTLAGGADGVLVLACAEKACQYLEGSMRSRKRMDYARSWLRKIGIEQQRLEFIHSPPMNREALEKTLKEFMYRLESFGTIPASAQVKTS